MQLMKVRYIGKEAFTDEYNGKKYTFSRKNPVSEIPTEVFAHIMQANTFFTRDLVPYLEETKKEPETHKPTVEEEINKMEADIKKGVEENVNAKQKRGYIKRSSRSR